MNNAFENRKLLYIDCKNKMLNLKQIYMNTLSRENKLQLAGSDIIDHANSEISFQQSQFFRDRMKKTLPEINKALERIDAGTYGLCEISSEPIEEKRLLAVPWARFSLSSLQEEAV